MRLDPLYRATFTTPEAWSVELEGEHGTEGQSFLIAEGRLEGRLSARLRGANFPRRRAGAAGVRELVGSITHLTDDDRYAWLNSSVCALAGEVRPLEGGHGFGVVLEVSEIVWEPPGHVWTAGGWC